MYCELWNTECFRSLCKTWKKEGRQIMQAFYIDRCTEYPQMTPGCSLVADSKDPLCCKVPQCQVPPKYSNQTGFIDIPTPPPGVITGGSVTKVSDFNEWAIFMVILFMYILWNRICSGTLSWNLLVTLTNKWWISETEMLANMSPNREKKYEYLLHVFNDFDKKFADLN